MRGCSNESAGTGAGGAVSAADVDTDQSHVIKLHCGDSYFRCGRNLERAPMAIGE